MNYANIKKTDIANGPGVRVSLFISGCRNRCKGCFNPETWDFGYGNKFTDEVANDILKACAPDYIRGISILGGEPFEPENRAELACFLHGFNEQYPDKTVWCYTGFQFDQLLRAHIFKIGEPGIGNYQTITDMLKEIDVLVDGPFVEELRDPRLAFRGSSNQRFIDVQASLQNEHVIFWEGEIHE